MGVLSGKAGALSSKRSQVFWRADAPPTSDIKSTLAPFGPTNSTSRSLACACVRLVSVTRTLTTAAVSPETSNVDGYGFARPDSGIPMGVLEEANAEVSRTWLVTV